MQTNTFDIVVIGAGIAGASIAAELAQQANVCLLERETQPGYHTTGRSAALYSCSYGPTVIRALSRASSDFYYNPKSEFISSPLLKPRGLVFVARKDQAAAVEATMTDLGPGITKLSAEKARQMRPLLRADYVDQGLYEEGSADIDVDALHQHYLKTFKSLGGTTITASDVIALDKTATGWEIQTPQNRYKSAIVVNAAGAWADEIAKLATVAPVGLIPKRRTALLVSPPPQMEVDGWPMAVDIDEQF